MAGIHNCYGFAIISIGVIPSAFVGHKTALSSSQNRITSQKCEFYFVHNICVICAICVTFNRVSLLTFSLSFKSHTLNLLNILLRPLPSQVLQDKLLPISSQRSGCCDSSTMAFTKPSTSPALVNTPTRHSGRRVKNLPVISNRLS